MHHLNRERSNKMSIVITVTDPTRDEALRLADYFFEIAGYGKSAGVTSHRFEPNAARQSEILKQHIEDLAADGDDEGEEPETAPVEPEEVFSPHTQVRAP